MNSAMWSAASTISLRYRISCRIQEPRLLEDGSPNQRFQPVLRDQIHSALEEMRQLQHRSGIIHQIDLSIRSEEHTSELQSPCNLVCPLLLEKKKRLGGGGAEGGQAERARGRRRRAARL